MTAGAAAVALMALSRTGISFPSNGKITSADDLFFVWPVLYDDDDDRVNHHSLGQGLGHEGHLAQSVDHWDVQVGKKAVDQLFRQQFGD